MVWQQVFKCVQLDSKLLFKNICKGSYTLLRIKQGSFFHSSWVYINVMGRRQILTE